MDYSSGKKLKLNKTEGLLISEGAYDIDNHILYFTSYNEDMDDYTLYKLNYSDENSGYKIKKKARFVSFLREKSKGFNWQ